MVGTGNQAAAVLTERSIAMFSPVAVLFVGIAGALRGDVSLGDIAVATRIYAFHGGRMEPIGFMARPRCWDAPHGLLQLAHDAAGTRWWGQRRRRAKLSGWTRINSPPAIHFAPIASGEIVLNSSHSELATYLRHNFNDAVAIDTEDAGFAQAGHLNPSTPALAIRGISDSADGRKDSTDRAGWRTVAAQNAAAFALVLASRIAAESEAGTKMGSVSTVRPNTSYSPPGPPPGPPVPPVPEKQPTQTSHTIIKARMRDNQGAVTFGPNSPAIILGERPEDGK